MLTKTEIKSDVIAPGIEALMRILDRHGELEELGLITKLLGHVRLMSIDQIASIFGDAALESATKYELAHGSWPEDQGEWVHKTEMLFRHDRDMVRAGILETIAGEMLHIEYCEQMLKNAVRQLLTNSGIKDLDLGERE